MSRIKEIAMLLERLGHDELRTLQLLVERVVGGRVQYGEVRLHSDGRNFVHEATEEALDASFYLALQLVRLGATGAAPESEEPDTETVEALPLVPSNGTGKP